MTRKISFATNLDTVGFDAYRGAPAARNVSGSLSGDLGGGELRMDSKDFFPCTWTRFSPSPGSTCRPTPG
nr:hypothetical protein GCM10020185_19730 [Pseudomonas brassicacearum subsp. brassicacearum]